jgi:hypothetical protein
LVPETITPSAELNSIAEAANPLETLQRAAGSTFDAGLSQAGLIGVSVRKIYRHEDAIVDVRIENNFQGLPQYHGSVRMESETALGWREAFARLTAYRELMAEITARLDHMVGLGEQRQSAHGAIR